MAESLKDAMGRRVKEAEKVLVPDFPDVVNLPNYKVKVIQQVIAASGRRDVKKVTRWVQEVEKSSKGFKRLRKSGRNFETLDMKLAASLSKTLKGEFARSVAVKEARRLRDHGKPLNGRQLLWLIYDHFRVNRNLGRAYQTMDLMNVKWRGDKVEEMKAFRTDWEQMLARFVGKKDMTTIGELYMNQVSRSQVLKIQVNEVRRKAYKPKKEYKKLRMIIDDHVALYQEIDNRSRQVEALSKGPRNRDFALPAESAVKEAEVRLNYLKGKCKSKSCPRLHPAGQEGCMSASAAPAPGSSSQAGGRQLSPRGSGPPGGGGGGGGGGSRNDAGKSKGKNKKGKGKGDRAGSRSSKGSGKGGGRPGSRPSSQGSRGRDTRPKLTKEQKKKMPCVFWNTGGCKKGNDCEWAHRTATAEEKKKFPSRWASGGRSPSPVPRKKACAAFLKDRRCPYGDNCKFAHDTEAASPAPRSPRAGGAGM